jgi:hypothetical protein
MFADRIEMPQRFSYQHPGYAFLNAYGSLQGEADVLHYADFLRREAGLEDVLPVDLGQIYARFCMPEPVRAPLEAQQGILVNSDKGLVLVKGDDPIVRQRFTEGHELMEFLFDAHNDAQVKLGLPPWPELEKEKLCDAGAAELLMPRSSFSDRLMHLGLSLAAARKLAAQYETSMLATLIRMVELSAKGAALLLCGYSLKPTERRRDPAGAIAQLRIQWCRPNAYWQAGYIPKDKSIAPDSLIDQAATSGIAQIGSETFLWGGKQIHCQVEALPLKVAGEAYVAVLLRA